MTPLVAEAQARHAAGDLAGAERLYRRALQADPRNAGALRLLAALLAARGNPTEGLRLARRASSLVPDDPELWRLRADLHVRLGETAEALACLDRCDSLRPDDPVVALNRGSLLARAGRATEALAAFDAALQLAPGAPAALSSRGLALLELNRPAEALASFDQWQALSPADPAMHEQRGQALQALDRHEEAIACFDRALARQPRFPDALNHRGVSQQALGDTEAALASYDAAIALAPDDPWYRWNAGLCHLLRGEYEAGWAGFEARLRTGAIPQPRFDRPAWQGEKLRGRTLLLHTEQGLGDIIQFARFAPLLPDAGRVVLQVPAVLLDLLRGLPVEVVPVGTRPPRFDLHCPLLSLPARLRITRADLPAADIPYLHVPAARVADLAARIGPGGRRIGICWQGNPAVRIDRDRSVPLHQFRALAAVPDVRLISLQKTHGLDQIGALPELEVLGPDGPRDFLETAAAMRALDLVITSDTVTAHLAGALGCPVWLATSFVPDWRWERSGETSPWYPSMRLFRQQRRGDWGSVFAAMAAALTGA
ncbi:MAG: tetratricopeptide repeat protein [Rhodospirillales bacterium]|nr:tetratricopeptide repeat protein [Rhodospirillales bacterium]MBN8907630.1 tetratricopeptide repeat protein [Rhodospirillales bacterium]